MRPVYDGGKVAAYVGCESQRTLEVGDGEPHPWGYGEDLPAENLFKLSLAQLGQRGGVGCARDDGEDGRIVTQSDIVDRARYSRRRSRDSVRLTW